MLKYFGGIHYQYSPSVLVERVCFTSNDTKQYLYTYYLFSYNKNMSYVR